MDIKKRRRRRVAILVLITFVICGGLAAVIGLQRIKREREAQYHRDQGMAAIEAQDYSAAIVHLSRYLERHGDDAESADAHHALAKASLEVPQPRNGHLRIALDALQRTVALDPTNREAAHELIEIYRLINASEQTLELANKLLTEDPADARAMGDKAIALSRLDRVDEARDVALDAVRLDPDNYRLHLILLQVQRQMDTPKEELVAYGIEQAEKHPGDPRFELVAGLSSALAGQEHGETAKGWLRQAASRPLPDPKLAADLVAVLDTMNLWSDSLAVLKKAADLGDSTMGVDYLRRLLEAERHADLAARLADTDASDRTTKLEAQVLRAMALHNLGKAEEVRAVLKGIAERKDSPLAAVWADVLTKVYDEQLPLPQRLAAVKEAMTTIIDNAYLHAFLGDAYSALGDHEMALQHWQQAANLRAPWGNVRLLVARALLNANRPVEAVPYAEAALMRLPESLPAAVTVVRTRSEAMGSIPGDSPQRLLELIEKVQKAAPGEPQTLIAKVDMLARAGQTAEAQRIGQELMAREAGLPQSLLGWLTEVDRRHTLGLAEGLEAQFTARMEGTPELALSQATELARQGQLKQGLALLDRGLVDAPAKEKLGWELARAAYLDAVDDPSSATTWVQLADNNPDDRRVQQMALRAKAVQADRAFTERVLARLQKLMGEDNVTWQTERARWLAASGKETDATQAVTLLRHIIERAPKQLEPRLLLARTLVQLNRPQLAVQELRAAEQSMPGSIQLWLELARLYQARRDFTNAATYIDQTLASPDLGDDHRREAALLLARQGALPRAIQLMEQLTEDGGTADERLVLASLYARADRVADAEKLMPGLLQQPTAASLALALDLYTAQGDEAKVREVLAHVESAAIPEAARQRVLAEHAARTGRPDEALRLLTAATAAAPTDADLWRQRVRLHLMQAQGGEAVSAAQEGLKQAPADAALKAVVDYAALVTRFAGDAWGRRLLLGMVEDPAAAAPGAAALRVLGETKPNDRDAAVAAAKQLGDLAREHQGFLALQLIAGRKLMETGNTDAAVDLMLRAATAFPEAVEPLAMQAEALASAGRWGDALAAAAEWRRRSEASALGPDLIMAEAHLQLDQPARAIEQLKPYDAEARANPEAHADVATRLVRALVALGRHDEAMAILTPRLPESAAWRGLAMGLASGQIGDPAVAAAWMRQAAAHAPAEDVGERMTVAQAWWTLAQRLRDPALAQEAEAVVADLTARPQAPAAAWYMRGVMAEQDRDASAAEQAYREALRLEPGLASAQNNLAMVLSQRGDDPAEALQLAEAATRAEPQNASFLDTLAFVQAKAGRVDAAVETMRRVIGLDPTTKLWYDNLAQILRDAGQPDEAQKVQDQYEARALRM